MTLNTAENVLRNTLIDIDIVKKNFDVPSLSDKDKLALTVLIQKNAKIIPNFDINYGYRYPEAEDVFGLTPDATKDKLDKLYEMGYLNRILFSTILKCPYCGEFKQLLILRCPHCNSMMLQKGSTLKHYKCGNQDFEEKFIKEEKYVCPICQRKLEKLGVDFIKIGTWYQCFECEEFFGEPLDKLICLTCEKEYIRDETILQPIWGYVINESKIKEVMIDIEFDRLISELNSNWNVKLFDKIRGESGIEHVFSLIVSTKGALYRNVVIDVEYSNNPVKEEAAMKFFAKIMDVKVDKSILIVVPRLEESAKKLAEWYKINFLETEKLSNLLNKLNFILREVLD